jgi:hypothetical protein
VWFHPWGGDPRIVGYNSAAGPGGDPNGDTAVWFEESNYPLNPGPGELVVYDTAAGREMSRTLQSPGVTGSGGDHYPAGNGFLQVSAERVVWNSGDKIYSHDVRTQSTSEVKTPKERYLIRDVHGDVEAFGERGSWNLVLRVPGRAEEPYPGLESQVRLSPSGNYVLAVEATEEHHGAVIVDTRTGELWPVPKNVFPLIAWSYGDIAMVDHIEDGRRIGVLLACDAARHACERLPTEGAILMPTN